MENRKTRKFEGTCYIPGEQLALMAKYYRGANLNLNLTLVEDDVALMNESLGNSCWCSKLDEVDRMKLQHMKGSEWRIQHDHHLERYDSGRGSGGCCFSPAKLSGVRQEDRADKGTDTISLYNRSQKKDRYDSWHDMLKNTQTRHDDGGRYLRRQSPRGFVSQGAEYQRPQRDAYLYPVKRSLSFDVEERQRRYKDRQSEDEMSHHWPLEQRDDDIKCVVCHKDVCAICKNPLRGSPCRCKCVVPNAGLCNECDLQCDNKESDREVSTSGRQEVTQTNWCNLMLLMMGSQMMKRPANTESCCTCNQQKSKSISVCDSESASSCSCATGKVQKIYLYDCKSKEKCKTRKPRKKPPSTESSSDCDCCKCSKKRKFQDRESRSDRNSPPSSQTEKEPEQYKRSILNQRKSVTKNDDQNQLDKPKDSVISTQERTSNGGVKRDRHSWFRKPLEDEHSKSTKKEKNNKRRKVEDSDDDRKSVVQSEEVIDRNKSSDSSAANMNDFLVCLPKIKSGLEQLLNRLEHENRRPYEDNVHSSSPGTRSYFNCFKMHGNTPFVTHPAGYAPLSSNPHGDKIFSSPKIHDNFQYGIVPNQNINFASPREFDTFNESVPNLKFNTVHSMDQQRHRVLTALCPGKRDSGTYGSEYDDLLSFHFSPSDNNQNVGTSNVFGVQYNHPVSEVNAMYEGLKSTNDLRRSNEMCCIEEVPKLNFSSGQHVGTRNMAGLYNQPFSPRKPCISENSACELPKIQNNLSKTDASSKQIDNTTEDQCFRGGVIDHRLSSNRNYSAVATDKNVMTLGAQSSNEPVQSANSVGSKLTSEQFMSAIDGIEHLSEDSLVLESENKVGITRGQANDAHLGISATQSVGPGHFRLSTTPDFKSLQGPSRQNCSKRKRLEDEGANDIGTKEGENHHQQIQENHAFSVKTPNVDSPKNQETAVRVENMCATTAKVCSRMKEPHESVISLSETLVKTSDSCNIFLSNMEIKTIHPSLKGDAQFFNMIDQIESISGQDVSKESIQVGLARSSPPNSDEDSNLPNLPLESPGLVDTMCSHDGRKSLNMRQIGQNTAGSLQGAKFKWAQEAIQAMLQNVNELLASIESDSDLKIAAGSSNYDEREQKSCIIRNEYGSAQGTIPKKQMSQEPCSDNTMKKESKFKTDEENCEQHQIRPSFSNNHLCSKTPSPQSSGGWQNRKKEYFKLNSGNSNSSVFTEQLLQSLTTENSSPNLTAVLKPEESSSGRILERTYSPKPLKRRSWLFPPQ